VKKAKSVSGHRREVGQGYERLMERIVDVIGPLKVRQGGPVGPQHVVRDFNELKADGFRRLGPVADRHAVRRHVAGRKKGTDLETHGLPFVAAWRSACGAA
jgi:hypothetical protein